MVIGLIINLILSLWIIPEYLGEKRKIGFNKSLLACLFLTPIIGVIITLLSPKLEEYKKENQTKIKNRVKQYTIVNQENENINERLYKLQNLREKGILTEEEYLEKQTVLQNKKGENNLKRLPEYEDLKQLFDENVLTKKEFDSKVEILIAKCKANSNYIVAENEISTNGLQKLGGFKEGMARIWDEVQQYGFIDENNMIIIPPKYDLAEDFNEGLALVMGYGNYGFINKKGDVVIHLQYDDAKSFENGIAKVKLGKEEFYIDKTGKEVDK